MRRQRIGEETADGDGKSDSPGEIKGKNETVGRANSAVRLGGEFKIDERSLKANLEVDVANCRLVDTPLQY